MKHAKTIRRSVAGLALAGVAGAAMLTATGNAMVAYYDDHEGETVSVSGLKDFTKIRIKGAFELKLTAGKDFSLKIEGDDRDVERVEAYVRNGMLTIDNSDDDNDRGIHIGSDDVTVTVTLPKLEAFEVLGAVDAELEGLDSESLMVELKGAGAIEMEGTCGALEIDLKGAGEVDAEELKCADVEVDVKGVGEAKVHASESVDASVSGIGSITVYGDPKKVRQSDSWLGRIRIK